MRDQDILTNNAYLQYIYLRQHLVKIMTSELFGSKFAAEVVQNVEKLMETFGNLQLDRTKMRATGQQH